MVWVALMISCPADCEILGYGNATSQDPSFIPAAVAIYAETEHVGFPPTRIGLPSSGGGRRGDPTLGGDTLDKSARGVVYCCTPINCCLPSSFDH